MPNYGPGIDSDKICEDSSTEIPQILPHKLFGWSAQIVQNILDVIEKIPYCASVVHGCN